VPSGEGRDVGGASASRAQSDRFFADPRFNRDVTRLVELGPRAVAEFLAEIGRDYLLRLVIEELLRRYVTRLTPEMLRAAGGDRFAGAQVRLVP
jgi:hypothetical protein